MDFNWIKYLFDEFVKQRLLFDYDKDWEKLLKKVIL